MGEKKQIFIQIHTCGNRYFIDGNSLLKLHLEDKLLGNLDQIYEFSMEEINELITNFNNENDDVEAKAYSTFISKEEIEEKLDTNDMTKTSWDELYRDAITMGKSEADAIKYADNQTINNDLAFMNI